MAEKRLLTPKTRPLEPEEKALLQAETERVLAEKAMIEQQAAGFAAGASLTQIELAHKQRAYEEIMAKDFYHHVYRFNASVDAKSVAECMYQLSQWDRRDPECPVTIVFTSPGGSVVEGMALWDFLTEFKTRHHLTTVAHGMAASMAGFLLQAGHHRVLGSESYILIHQVQASAMGSWGDLQDRMKWLKKVQERMVVIFAEKSKLTKEEIESKWERTDWWIDSTEALKLGLVDEVR